MTLQHERATGMNASDAETKLSTQLDGERTEKLKLAQQLTQEQTLRQRADVGMAALQREVQVRTREAELASQRLQNTQLELQQARLGPSLCRCCYREPPSLLLLCSCFSSTTVTTVTTSTTVTTTGAHRVARDARRRGGG